MFEILEDDRRQSAFNASSKRRVVVPIFQKESAGWKAVDLIENEMTWTIAFDGKALRAFKSSPESKEGQSS